MGLLKLLGIKGKDDLQKDQTLLELRKSLQRERDYLHDVANGPFLFNPYSIEFSLAPYSK